ncbi:TruB Pseudouridine synthase [Burkholderiaceae bacterium]
MAQRIDGVVLLDKPCGMTSQSAVTSVKRLLHADKAGHTGTLDPMATGLLPICLGEATKYSQDLLDADKKYQARLRFGIQTDTGDAQGQVIAEKPTAEVTDNAMAKSLIDGILPQFMGEIEQVPPMYSALKRDGKPLYEYARAGVEIERESRKITIYSITVLDVSWPEIALEVHCSKGTYIRVLAEDIGHVLGCGAHLIGLRRTMVGHLSLDRAVTLDGICDMAPQVLPVDALLQSLPELTVDDHQAKRLEMGQRVPCALNIASQWADSLFRIYRSQALPQNFIGTADWRSGVLHPRRFIAQRLINQN